MITATDGFTEVEITSEAASIIVVRPTNITVQPQSQPVAEGSTVILTMDAEAIGAPTDFVPQYQWKKRFWDPQAVAYVDSNVVDDDRITGSRSNRLTIRELTDMDTLDQYVCEVTGYCGEATTKPAKLFIPTVGASTTTPVACVGSMIALECAVFPSAIPGSDLNFQWYRDGVAVDGATNKTLFIDPAAAGDAGMYRCDATYTGVDVTVPSNEVNVEIGEAPTVAEQPEGDTVCAGETVMLSVQGNGAGVTYHWQKGTTLIPGAVNATYQIADITEAAAGTYSCVVMNPCGEVTSEAVDVVVNSTVEVTSQPEDVAVFDGDEISFTVESDGAEPVTYQWYKGDAAIDGATEATLTIDSATGEDAGEYYCNRF